MIKRWLLGLPKEEKKKVPPRKENNGPSVSPNIGSADKEKSRWIDMKEKKPDEVVLAAIFTYDCGWVQDTAWWSKKDECWYCTGGYGGAVNSTLNYTHWTPLDYSDMPIEPDWRLPNDN